MSLLCLNFRADFDVEPFLKHYFSTFVAWKEKLVIFEDSTYRIEDNLKEIIEEK